MNFKLILYLICNSFHFHRLQLKQLKEIQLYLLDFLEQFQYSLFQFTSLHMQKKNYQTH
jgi:hypothetical protein